MSAGPLAETLLSESLALGRATLGDAIYVELRKRIVSLACRPGTMIFENVVASEFGVSRTPVRQAFARLASEELLQVLPQRGARVSQLTVRKVKEAQAVREALEIAAFADVARRWDERDPDCRLTAIEAEACIAAQKQAVARRDYLAFVGLDEDYHNLILGLGGNTTLIAIVNQMRAHLTRLRYLELQEAHHEAEGIVWHERILSALRAGDVEATESLLRSHLKVLEGLREELFRKYADVFA
jgi:DNA-binding GntR family transcriptional regulator